MAKSPRLNVYVTPAGFYDAVVAAPNQKAALQAWGARSNLFTEKLAFAEEDAHWRDLALASPGEVIRKPRGDTAAILAAPAPERHAAPMSKPKKDASLARARRPEPPPPPAPPPDRSALDAAEAALKAAQVARNEAESRWAERRRRLEADAKAELAQAETSIRRAEAERKREAAAFRAASR